MANTSFVDEVRQKSDGQLANMLDSHDLNDIGRHIVLAEMGRRATVRAARPNAIAKWSLVVAVLSMLFAAVAAWPVVRCWIFP